MADQKSRGGQKNVSGTPGHTDEKRYPEGERDMAEDARRGQQSNQGGYHDDKPQSTGKEDKS